ncbi:hypothetical protein RJ640_026054 [Escallonia rubra]|uniref:DUF4219 domain-containing protein n=1 Tax=Escallonia rubra TaxID=112253 RepID=A0AA88QMS1_9ASTE|nr:hypothetical protein RJ640_026054 [Escallonia rubra]
MSDVIKTVTEECLEKGIAVCKDGALFRKIGKRIRAKDLNMEEVSATTRPPLLKNENYSYWKNQMRNFLRQDTHVWYVVENGPIIPMKDGPDRTKVPKGILEMDTHETHLFSMDDRAKNITSYELDINEYNQVSACEIAREMWRLLEVIHEGTNHVKESKINMLVQQYEAFKMKENESINEMYSWFTLIINGHMLLGKTYPEKEIVRKTLRSLPKRWEAKVTAIQEAKDLNVLKLEELVGSLMTHEITMKIHDEEENTLKKKNLALKAEHLINLQRAAMTPIRTWPSSLVSSKNSLQTDEMESSGGVRQINHNKETMVIGTQEKILTLAMNVVELDTSRSTAHSSRINQQAVVAEIQKKRNSNPEKFC